MKIAPHNTLVTLSFSGILTVSLSKDQRGKKYCMQTTRHYFQPRLKLAAKKYCHYFQARFKLATYLSPRSRRVPIPIKLGISNQIQDNYLLPPRYQMSCMYFKLQMIQIQVSCQILALEAVIYCIATQWQKFRIYNQKEKYLKQIFILVYWA